MIILFCLLDAQAMNPEDTSASISNPRGSERDQTSTDQKREGSALKQDGDKKRQMDRKRRETDTEENGRKKAREEEREKQASINVASAAQMKTRDEKSEKLLQKRSKERKIHQQRREGEKKIWQQKCARTKDKREKHKRKRPADPHHRDDRPEET